MDIIFTRGSSILSKLIRSLTGEPVSHCAIAEAGVVIHMNLYGMQTETEEQFETHAEIVYRVSVPEDCTRLLNLYVQYRKSMYDFGGLLYLGLRYLLPRLPKANLWQTTGMFLCTEWITEFLTGEEDHEITPYKLYELLNSRKGE